MPNNFSNEVYAFWGITTILQAVLVEIVFKYRHERQFPAFAAYVFFTFIRSVGLMLLSVLGNQEVYFFTYWAAQVFVFAFLFCVVHEVFESITERATLLSRNTKRVLIRIATTGAVVAVAASLQVPESQYPLMEAIISLQRGLGAAIFLFMTVVVISAQAYSVEWHRRDSGIAIGVFITFSFQTLWPGLSAFLSGSSDQHFYRMSGLVLDILANMIWIYSFFRASQKGDYFKAPVAKHRFRVILGGKYRNHRRTSAAQRFGS